MAQAEIMETAARLGKNVYDITEGPGDDSFLHFDAGGCPIANLTSNAGEVSPADFELLRVLGTGAFGKVFLVRKNSGLDNGKLYAMKVLKKASIAHDPKEAEHARAERSILESISQTPFTVKLHYAFQDDAKLHIILDYVNGGELYTHHMRARRFPEETARFYVSEIVVAMTFLHSLGIIYRDLKLENVLLDNEGHVVLTDFGLSKEFVLNDGDRSYSYVGTLEYMAPEFLVHGGKGHSLSVDWWSVGCLLSELVAGRTPFIVEGHENTEDKIRERILRGPPTLPSWFSPALKDIVLQFLQRDPAKRLCDPDKIKGHAFFDGVDWAAVEARKVEAPFRPQIAGELDVGNFDDSFTAMSATMSPAPPVTASARKVFRGFSFVAPNVLYSSKLFGHSGDAGGLEHSPAEFLKQYKVEEELIGVGSFSSVRRCVNRATGVEYAVKVVSKYKSNTEREVAILRQVQGHANIIRLVDYYQDDLHAYIVTDLMRGGELLDRIKSLRKFTEEVAKRLFRTMADIVNYLHTKGVVHRDLKPENLLFTGPEEDAELVLVDFGFAREVPRDSKVLQTPCFTEGYAAPEVLGQMMYGTGYDQSCDIWSLGVILYTMLCGYPPFHSGREGLGDSLSRAQLLKAIHGDRLAFPVEEWENVSESAKDCVRLLLTVEAADRPTVRQILRHPWLYDGESNAPLASPAVLRQSDGTIVLPQFQRKRSKTASQLQLDLFQRRIREGILLADVSKAPLAKRRKMRRSGGSGGSASEEGGSEKGNPAASSPFLKRLAEGEQDAAQVA